MKKFMQWLFATLFITTLAVGAFAKNTTTKKAALGTQVTCSIGAVSLSKVGDSPRKILTTLKTKFPKSVIAPGFIRCEQLLVNGNGEYTFTLKTLGNESPTENKLNEQDGFMILGYGIFLLRESTTVGGISVLQTYPNAQIFPDEAGLGLKNQHLEVVYNGKLTMKVGDTTYLPGAYTGDCRVVRTTLQSGTLTQSEKHAGDGFVALCPQYFVRGRELNEIKLRVPANANQLVQSTGGTYNTKVVLILQGFTVSGQGNTAIDANT